MAEIRVRPLDHWPRERVRHHQRSRFEASWTATVTLLRRELDHLDARNAAILVDCAADDIRVDGTMPKATARVGYPGVVVAFDSVHGPLKYAADRFDRWQDNVRAIALGLEALRKVDRYGITSRGEQYTGWAQLPSGSHTADSSMTVDEAALFLAEHAGHPESWDLLRDDTTKGRRVVARSYRMAAQRLHPDVPGGDAALFQRLQTAHDVLQEAMDA